ncbi:kelch domain-containing protein 10 homolog isoform X1 [Microplitis demolitor]|uniref:kelch domain-containing protein 10 homolog isoform X1 n=1 Tax=Microplitis demolitor TaxID=69319 RepID=UPI0004CCC2DE|nr:kelch domain-containing protein 10 homolog isoform X1 [Microplitis demolitor]
MYVFKPFVLTEINNKDRIKPSARRWPNIVNNDKYLYLYCGTTRLENDDKEKDPGDDFDDSDGEVSDEESFSTEYTVKYLQDMWEFNLATETWRCLPDRSYPSDDENIIGVGLNESTIVATTQGVNNENNVYVYDLIDNTKDVKIKLIQEWPSRLFCFNLISHENYFYTVAYGEYGINVFKLDYGTGSWTRIDRQCLNSFTEVLPFGEFNTAFDGKIFVFIVDDWRQDHRKPIKKTVAFDLEKRQWEDIETIGDDGKNYPEFRTGFNLCQYTDPDTGEVNVILTGGVADTKYYDDVWRLNLHTLQWTCLNKFGSVLPIPITDHAATITDNGKLYVFGGITGTQDDKFIRVDALYSTWLRIPRLTDICWEAVIYYYGDLSTKSDEEFKKMGLPPKFVKSIIE